MEKIEIINDTKGQRKYIRNSKAKILPEANRKIPTKKSGIKEYSGCGSGNHTPKNHGSGFTYTLREYNPGLFGMPIQKRFNKQQLTGKLIRIYGKLWRVIA